jgi:hypothetical protein
MLEGAEGISGHSPPGLGVPLFRTESRAPSSLDVLVSLDEPEQLVRELKGIAGQYPKSDKRWLGVLRLCERAEEYFEHISKPQPNRPQP